MHTHHTKSTKIVATIGPATETEETIEKLIKAGMNVARFNTKHGTPEWHQERMLRVRRVAERLQTPVAVLVDLQGPEIRINVPDTAGFAVSDGDRVTVTANPGENPHVISVPQDVIDVLAVGNTILIDDGLGEFEVIEKNGADLTIAAHGSFTVGNRKTLNTPGVVIDLPSLIPNDFVFLDALTGADVDYIALSFVRNAQDIQILREEMQKRNCVTAIMAKIENQSALDNIEEIIRASDAVMVARGDLAVEVPFEQLAFWQKKIITRCRQLAKPVLTATQMLKSMVENPRPTRAEVTDVANAVYDGTDAVMLSEETTIGKYPVEAVATQAKIAQFNEQHLNLPELAVTRLSPADDIAFAALSLLNDCETQPDATQVKEVVCLTETGTTARLLARYRPDLHVHALTSSTQTYSQLALVHGVIPHVVELPEHNQLGQSDELLKIIRSLNIAQPGELILVIRGMVWKEPGKTSTLSLVSIPQETHE
jgi:pyruvate kinase